MKRFRIWLAKKLIPKGIYFYMTDIRHDGFTVSTANSGDGFEKNYFFYDSSSSNFTGPAIPPPKG